MLKSSDKIINFVCGLFDDDVNSADYAASNYRIADCLKGMRKEAVVA
jgi:hypothetical protein